VDPRWRSGVNFTRAEVCGTFSVGLVPLHGMFWDENGKHKFDVIVALDRLDERLRPGFAARLSILGDQISHAVSIPAEAVSNAMKKKIVYCQRSGGFEPKEVKVRALSEGRAILEGIPLWNRGGVVNPEKKPTGNPRQARAEVLR